MDSKNQTAAETNYKVLAFLFSSGQWENIREIGRKTDTSQNPSRLKTTLEEFVQREIIQSWENLPENERKIIQNDKNQTKPIMRQNNYRITEKGRDKFFKIRDDCLDPDTRIILKMQRAS